MNKKMSESFSFNSRFKVFGLISICLCAVGIVALVLMPFGVTLFNFDIDFLGGTTMEYELHTEMTHDQLNEIAAIVTEITGREPNPPQKTGENGTSVLIKTVDIPSEQRDEIFKALQEKYGTAAAPITEDDILSVENVGSSVGRDLQRAAVTATLVAALLILLYITIRFQFSSGLAAVITLIHDLLVMLSFYVIFQIPMNMNFIAAMLTILGYSINAVIVVFDRVRENKRLMGPKASFAANIDKSIWQTLRRNINTTVTTLLPVILLIILGVGSVRNFILPLAVGIVAGAYSSICLAGPLWLRIRKKDA